ncbi:hypothetical protein THRCLA_09579 [Thraustotheca clavata]|uniref:CCZ1/INTU/HSP4 first Longin domain-containing protein n=1 Tax=Thraustotheca clavata TaxID=74557 RepID=A0A1V9YW59_9STRA|nr:hypothetical protein THRCLA_09579 [Thraustotheca clavata]
MEVLLWHQELGSDDDAASEEESVARVLYFWPPSSRSEQLNVLQLLQGAYAFAASFGDANEVIIVELTGRTYCYYECEPHVWIALGLSPNVCNEKTMEIILHEMYKMFRLLYGEVNSSLQSTENEDGGMNILKQIGQSRKLLRKASSRAVQVENDSDSSAFSAALDEMEFLKVSITSMENTSPLPHFQAKCDDFFPTYLEAIDFNHLFEAKGIVYLPADKNIQLTLQLLLQTLLTEVPNVVSTAAFLHGKLAWSQIPLEELCTIYNFLQLREQVGYFSLCKSTPSSFSPWIRSNQKRSFYPIWASSQVYEENDPDPSPKRRLSARDILSGNFKDEPKLRTSGFQCHKGTFTRSWEEEDIWSPAILCSPSMGEAPHAKMLVWHTDFSLLPLHFLAPTIPPAIKRVLDEARAKLSKDEHLLDLCVKTPLDGWVVIRRTGTLGRELTAFFNSNIETIEDLSLSMTELILDSFQDTFM